MLKYIRNVDYVILLCDNLVNMKDFYKDVLGFQLSLETESWIEFQLGSTLLTISIRDRPYVGPPIPKGSASLQLAFRVPPDQIESCYEELKAKNVEIVQPPQVIDKRVWKYWKHRTLFFKDPESNLLEIYAEIDIS